MNQPHKLSKIRHFLCRLIFASPFGRWLAFGFTFFFSFFLLLSTLTQYHCWIVSTNGMCSTWKIQLKTKKKQEIICCHTDIFLRLRTAFLSVSFETKIDYQFSVRVAVVVSMSAHWLNSINHLTHTLIKVLELFNRDD